MANKKEYSIKINGVTQNIKDVTKLSDALAEMDKALEKNRTTTAKTAATSKERTKGLTDEEKAEKKLADTKKRVEQANSEANRKQIEANIALREATREVTRNIQISQLAEGSIRQMGMQLTDLRNEYEELTAAQRADTEVGVVLLEQIQALDAEYKALRESTGNFRDSVGNYEKATAGLNELKDKFELAARGSSQLASDILGSNAALDTFANTTDFVAKSTEQLTAIIALAQIAVQAYTAVSRDAVLQQKAAAVVDGVRAIQLKAKTAAEALATKGTIAARIAQFAFNLVAAANPYVLLAAALLGVVGVLYSFIRQTDSAAQKQKQLNEMQQVYLNQLDRESEKLKKVGAERILAAERALQLMIAQGDVIRQTGETEDSFNARRAVRTAQIRKLEDGLATERMKNNRAQRGFYGNEIRDLEKNQAEVEKLTGLLQELNAEKAKGEDVKMLIDMDFDGNLDLVKIDDAIEAVQGKIDNLGRSVQIAVDLNTETDQLAFDAAVLRANRLAEERQTAQAIADQRAAAAKEQRAAELAAVREGEDARMALIRSTRERERQMATTANKRQIEDIKIRLAEEKNLTATARKALNDTIVSLRKALAIELELMDQQYEDRALEILRSTEDTRMALLRDSGQRQREELQAQYDRQIEDLHLRLSRETDLTEDEAKQLTEQLLNLRAIRDAELAKMDAAALQARRDAALAAIESELSAVEARVGEVVRRSRTGLELIDVEATRKNMDAVNAALGKYIKDMMDYQNSLREAHEATLATLQEGTPEYEAEVQRYADAMVAATQKINAAQKQQIEGARSARDLMVTYYQELFGKISEIAGAIAEAVTGVVDTINMSLQSQLDDMNAQLDVVNEKYEKSKEEREKAATQVEELEARMQDASGGTAVALKEQLAAATAARNEANREEQRLAKEKEKREADIQRKERQMRRNDMLASIAQGFANTAQAVTKALTLMWPLNLVMAPIIGAIGLAQVGVMTSQLAKLEDGGEIKGPRHVDGGVLLNVAGRPAYEAEGGEYMINRRSYAGNSSLVEYINDANGPVSPMELMAFAGTPLIGDAPSASGDDRLLAAISAIEFRPVVAVQDINDVQDEMATVKDLSGY